MAECLKVKGAYRLTIADQDGTIRGDSGWHDNQITNLGFLNFLIGTMAARAGSIQVSHLALGTGGAPAAADTTLSGEIQKRQAVTAATSNTSKAITFTGTFSSANSFCTTTQNISNIGLFGTSSGGTLMCGNTFASSSCASNQNVNVTYTLSLS
jgi:hypothetical protein